MKARPLFFAILLSFGSIFTVSLLTGLAHSNASAAATSSSLPTPQPKENDRLAVPVLPEHPTQIDQGRSVYYYNCMPCHGDRGQGLTDEFRKVWVEDHQNCWGRGCHAGRADDEGFPIPRYVPPVTGQALLSKYPDPEELFSYLKATHPPQRPGVLLDDDYRSVTAYVFAESGAPLPEPDLALFENISGPGALGLYSLVTVLAGILLISQQKKAG